MIQNLFFDKNILQKKQMLKLICAKISESYIEECVCIAFNKQSESKSRKWKH
jgi:hypothetical protein